MVISSMGMGIHISKLMTPRLSQNEHDLGMTTLPTTGYSELQLKVCNLNQQVGSLKPHDVTSSMEFQVTEIYECVIILFYPHSTESTRVALG